MIAVRAFPQERGQVHQVLLTWSFEHAPSQSKAWPLGAVVDSIATCSLRLELQQIAQSEREGENETVVLTECMLRVTHQPTTVVMCGTRDVMFTAFLVAAGVRSAPVAIPGFTGRFL